MVKLVGKAEVGLTAGVRPLANGVEWVASSDVVWARGCTVHRAPSSKTKFRSRIKPAFPVFLQTALFDADGFSLTGALVVDHMLCCASASVVQDSEDAAAPGVHRRSIDGVTR